MIAPDRTSMSHLRDVPVGEFRFVALDVETACGEAGSICQIGLACVQQDNQIQTYSTVIDPKTDFDAFNIRLHGIGPNEVDGAALFPDAFEAMLPLLCTHTLVQHSNFDKHAIAAACRSYMMDAPDLDWRDSVTIARRAWPDLKGNGGHGLGNLKKVLNLDFQHHDAGEDARAAALVVLHAEQKLGVALHDMPRPKQRAKRRAPPAPLPDVT